MESLVGSDSPAAARELRERDLSMVVTALVRELHPQRSRFIDVRPSSRIERDLGIDSLGRTELILRIERAFRVRLSAQTIGEAETVHDLVQALEQAGPARERIALEPRQAPALPSVPAASEAQTLVEVLEWHAARHPDRLHLTVLQDETTILGTLTYGELATKARNLARGLIARDIVPGDRVALMLPTSIDFFIAFFGILYAGAIPVPIYPPMRLSQIEDHLRRQTGILRNAGARLLITVPEGRRLAGLLRAQVETLNAAESVENLESFAELIGLPQVEDPDSIALIQYTSGSTGDPKGVVLSHANLLANIRAMGVIMEASSADIFVSWLPLYHDMGLIGAWLGCLHFGAPLYAMSPLSFLVRPESWLWAIHRFRATFSASPNFGFELLITGSLLRRLGIPFVERYDVSSSLADAEALIALAREGRILVFFPEGTFTRRAGLSGFYLGAFKVAAEVNLPVLPGTIRGTRSLLRSDQWFPRRTAVAIEIGAPVMPSGTDFGSVVRLRDEVRKSVLSRCGEPDLGELVKPAATAP